MTRIGVAFISDRAERYLPGCAASFTVNVTGFNAGCHVVDDREHLLGMAGAVRAAWAWALDDIKVDYLFHVEEDFRFAAPVDLAAVAALLDANPQLAQVVLKRNPWSPEERAAGGIIEQHPGDYTDRDGWVEHGRVFSLNPCLIPRRVLEMGWPDGNEAEFTQRCLDAGYRFAFLGSRHDAPLVEHVGMVRGEGWRL